MFERIGWAVMGALLIAAALGAFGGGRRVETIESADGALRLEYPPVWRSLSPLALRVHFDPADPDDEARLWISRDYILRDVVLEHVVPEARTVEVGNDRLTYVFALEGRDGQRTVVFRVRPERAGRLHGSVGVEGGATIVFEQLIFP
jgi:hypothetical protein